MAIVKPFRAFRPKTALAKSIASKPYDVLNSTEAKAMAKGNEYSFLRINKPEIDLPDGTDLYSEEVYAKGKENLELFIRNNWLEQDGKACFYIYGQKMGEHHQLGLVACSAIDDYFNDVIKKHEYTRPKKEKDRLDHMYALKAHIGPVFLTYQPIERIDAIVNEWVSSNEPAYDFEAEDKIEHTVWVVNEASIVKELEDLFAANVKQTYVADGHHRSAASALVGQRLRDEKGVCSGEEDFNFFLSVLFPADQLKIIDYNRVINSFLPNITNDEFLTALLSNFRVYPSQEAVAPELIGEYGMYLDGKWYRLQADETILTSTDPVERLSISIISNYVIDPLFGINDQRTDDRIDFVGGIRGLKELERRVDSGEMKIAFSIPPVTINQLIEVADSGNVMPPKSTWFEPKLRSGLFVHKFG